MSTVRRWTIVLGLLTAFLLPTATASAATPIVYVEDHTGSAWPVYSAQNYVDQYTGSNIVYGACRSGYRCVKVYERTIQTSWFAVTQLGTPTYIYVNPQRNGRPFTERRNAITHELGHAFGITWHSTYCTNTMWAYVRCPDGTYPRHRFTTPQIDALRRH